jgi:hypothetical protein
MNNCFVRSLSENFRVYDGHERKVLKHPSGFTVIDL